MLTRLTLATLALIYLSACATSSPTPSYESIDFSLVPNEHFGRIAEAASRVEKDRRAILGMQGDYRVDFHFQETVSLAPSYERRDQKNSGGFETVVVVDDRPGRISLQHLLVVPGGHVVKHWRQDWTYEATHRFEFSEEQTWDTVALDAQKTRGAWTQCVFEVSDAPRYCGTGKWNHHYGVSTWTSDRTWRPLPRREYTQRSDYNAINAENRHTVTPHGWAHEQDNTKTLRQGNATAETLVREFGFNDYRAVENVDFSPAVDYWARTSDYWAKVRAAWARRMQPGSTLTLNTTVDGMTIIAGTFQQADQAAETDDATENAAIEALLTKWTTSRHPDPLSTPQSVGAQRSVR